MRSTALIFLSLLLPLAATEDGAALYQQSCAMCHGAQGRGIPGAFPPLAGSDFLLKHRERALKAPMEGLSGEIQVNGATYHGIMPSAILDDRQLVALFNHVFSSWGNEVPPVSEEEIRAVRATSRFRTFGELRDSQSAAALPEAPAGWVLEVGAPLSFSPTRLAVHPDGGHVLALAPNGDVWWWKPGGGDASLLIPASRYISGGGVDEGAMGMTVDSHGRLYIVCNRRDTTVKPVRSNVTIFRTGAWSEAHPWSKPEPWFRTPLPYGIGGYNHGVSHIAEGPDGMLYINSGARTDSGEPGTDPDYSMAGEDPHTAVIWKMDPAEESPKSAGIHASGLRNSYGFCWDDGGRMIATENGPNAHAPEELNLIEPGRHYGFPFRYSDLGTKFYPHQPVAPEGLVFTPPLRNLGPDGGGAGMGTFDPHSCPTGIVWLGKDWPAPLGGSFLTTRFGNMIQLEQDVGFDVLQLSVDADARTVGTKRLLHPLGRPVDLVKLPGHRLVIAEYTGATGSSAGMGTPGRLLLLRPAR